MQTLSLVWGVLAFLGMVIFSVPCLHLLNWVNVAFAAVGLVVSIVTLSISKAPNKSPTITGLACCGIVIVVGVLRLA
jgi:hypothetical protein